MLEIEARIAVYTEYTNVDPIGAVIGEKRKKNSQCIKKNLVVKK